MQDRTIIPDQRDDETFDEFRARATEALIALGLLN